MGERKMTKDSKIRNWQVDTCNSIRKPMPPASHFHTTKSGKKGYDRKESKRIERELVWNKKSHNLVKWKQSV